MPTISKQKQVALHRSIANRLAVQLVRTRKSFDIGCTPKGSGAQALIKGATDQYPSFKLTKAALLQRVRTIERKTRLKEKIMQSAVHDRYDSLHLMQESVLSVGDCKNLSAKLMTEMLSHPQCVENWAMGVSVPDQQGDGTITINRTAYNSRNAQTGRQAGYASFGTCAELPVPRQFKQSRPLSATAFITGPSRMSDSGSHSHSKHGK